MNPEDNSIDEMEGLEAAYYIGLSEGHKKGYEQGYEAGKNYAESLCSCNKKVDTDIEPDLD